MGPDHTAEPKRDGNWDATVLPVAGQARDRQPGGVAGKGGQTDRDGKGVRSPPHPPTCVIKLSKQRMRPSFRLVAGAGATPR